MPMAKQMSSSYMHNWIEVAPAPLISPQKPSLNAPKMETIVEEEGSNVDRFGLVHNKALLYLLPVLLSIVSYIFINRYIITTV